MSQVLNSKSRIFVAGHRGMVGSAIVRKLKAKGHESIIVRCRKDVDLTCQEAVKAFFRTEKIDYVVLAAAHVGGIHANSTYPADFIYLNLIIQSNVIHEAYASGVKDLLFLGSSCIYPKKCMQPMKEEYLLTGPLEPTNEPYAIAKIAGIKMCESYNRQYGTRFRSVMPTNLYGPGDNYDLENSHVIPAMIRKYHLAKMAMEGNLAEIQKDEQTYGLIPQDIKKALCLKPDSSDFLSDYEPPSGPSNRNPEVVESSVLNGKSSLLNPQISELRPHVLLWGTGNARREFLHVDDMASACYHVMNLSAKSLNLKSNAADNALPLTPYQSFLNVGTGRDTTIREVASLICNIVGFKGQTKYDSSMPDGTPQKLLDTQRINYEGWYPTYELMKGLADSYKWYLKNSEG